MTPTITRLDVPRERPTAGRPGAAEVDIASGGAGPRPVEDGASAAAEARRAELEPERFPPQPVRVGALQMALGINQGPLRRLEDYGPTSHLSEDLLLAGYGLRRAGEEAR